MLSALRAARRILCLGIGGGGDVAGAVVVAEIARLVGTDALVGGITWERRVIDPLPGPRRLSEVDGAQALNDWVALAGAGTSGPGGYLFAEARVAGALGLSTVLADPNGGPAALGAALADAAERLDCDLLVLLDVGGDALAHGDEPGLASPLADAICIAAAPHVAAAGVGVLGAVFGAGCDGELRPAEVLERVAEVAAAGGGAGAVGPDPDVLDRVERVVARVPTEATAMALRCARGATGTATIRSGRRTVELTPFGGLVFGFDPLVALDSAARLAAAVAGARSLEEANAVLGARGLVTELDAERAAPEAAQ